MKYFASYPTTLSQDISKILAGIFHDSELVPSDILAGLLVLHYKNKLEKSVRGTSLRRSAPSTVRYNLKSSCTLLY